MWLGCNSGPGSEFLGKYNVFAYAFQDLQTGDFSWLLGMGIAGVLTNMMIALIPIIIV